METSVFLELERAELAARERRLAAEAEAARLLDAARARALETEQAVGQRMADAVAERRRILLEQATAEAAAIDSEMTAQGSAPDGDFDESQPFRAAVELVVAAVLAEEH